MPPNAKSNATDAKLTEDRADRERTGGQDGLQGQLEALLASSRTKSEKTASEKVENDSKDKHEVGGIESKRRRCVSCRTSA